MSRFLTIGLAICVFASEPVGAQALPMCGGIGRPNLGEADQLALFKRVPQASLDSLLPGLMIVWVDGDSTVNAWAIKWERRFKELNAQDPERLRWILVYAMDRGLRGEAVPLMAVNEAAFWYRRVWGQPNPLLAFMQDLPSDRLLLPLSALNQPLSDVEEEFVFSVACDVGTALAAMHAATPPPALLTESRLAWVYAAERILRHAQRLIHGRRRAQLDALLAAVPVQTPPFDPKSFASDL